MVRRASQFIYFRFLPVSERLPRQVPSLFRERGCLPPPSSRTCGIFPALRSAINSPPPFSSRNELELPRVGLEADRTYSGAVRQTAREKTLASFNVDGGEDREGDSSSPLEDVAREGVTFRA